MLSMASFVGLAGCSKSDLISSPDNGRQMDFSTYVAGSTKGVTKEAFIVGDQFAVMATQSKNPWTNTDADWYMGSVADPTNTYVTVTKSPNSGDGIWKYNPVKLWPQEEHVSFFAFSPVPVGGGKTHGISNVTVTAGSPTLKFEVDADIKSQVDLLRAEALDKFEEEVQLNFSHALTRVSFAAKANVTAKQVVRLDKIELVGIKNKGTMKLYDPARVVGANNDMGGWVADASVTSYAPALSHEVVGVVPEALTPMTQDDQAMFMIPQRFTKGGAAKLLVEYSFSNDGGKKWVNNSKFEIDLGDYTEYWNPSKNYRYILTLSPDNVYTFSPTIVDWEAEIDVTFKDAVSATKLDIGRDAASKNEFTVTTTSTQWKGYKITSDAAWLKISDKADGSGAATAKEYTDQGVTKAGYELEKKWYIVAEENLTPLARKAKITLNRNDTGLPPIVIEVDQPTFDIDYSDTPANTYVLKTTDKGFIYMPGKKPRTKNGRIGADVIGGYNTDTKPSSVVVTWQTGRDLGNVSSTGMTVRSVVYDAASGKCAVAINGFAGNAYLTANYALTWGCTVWVTEGDIKTTPAVNGVRFMDRNLGAHAATATKPAAADAYKYFGNLYQWGRFQPFTGQGNTTATTPLYPTIFNGNNGAIPSGSIGGFTYTTAYAAAMASLIDSPQYILNDPNNNGGLITGNPTTWSDTGDKSVFDPCPFGYRVAPSGAWNGMTTTAQSVAMNAGIEWNSTWWPMGGYRQNTDGALVWTGGQGSYWTATCYPGTTRAKGVFFGLSAISYGDSYYSSGLSVRCVAE